MPSLESLSIPVRFTALATGVLVEFGRHGRLSTVIWPYASLNAHWQAACDAVRTEERQDG
jgi:hypothetical protein